MVPSLPPSELAPLSDTTITTVSSASPRSSNEGEHPADLLVGVRQEGGEALHEALGQDPLALVEAVPARDPRRTRGEHRALGDDAHGELAGEGLLAPGVPALGEATLVALDPLGRRVMGRVAGPGGEVQEEGQLVVDGAQVAQELDGPVGQIGAEVVAVVDRARRAHCVVVVVERRDELVGLPAVEAVPAVEATAERPGGPRVGHVGLALGAQVPLAHRVGGVPGGPQHLGEETVLARWPPPVAGEPGGQVGHAAHAAAMVVAPREQAGPRRRAQRGGVEVGQPHALGGDAVDEGRLDVGAVAAELGEADVVEHDQHDVGRALGRRRAAAATTAPSRASRCRSCPGTQFAPRVNPRLLGVRRALHSGRVRRTWAARRSARAAVTAVVYGTATAGTPTGVLRRCRSRDALTTSMTTRKPT